MMGQIHDSLIMGIHPDEKDYVLTTVEEIMTERIKTVAPWIIVPLIVEAELSPIGGSWNSLVPYEKDESGVWKPV
jgi:DNA polymerase I-like protein with 3'-5' exonuclease and polymerase domains